MSASLSIEFKTSGLEWALRNAPKTLTKHLRPALGRVALEISRDSRRNAPKAFSTLTTSISYSQSLEGLEAFVHPNTNYARAVEEGSGAGGVPSNEEILKWIKVKRITPNDPDMSDEDLGYVIRRKIYREGIKAQPYMAPAMDMNTESGQRKIDAAIADAIREIN